MEPVAANGSKFWKQLKDAAIILNGGVAVFGAINLYRGNEKFYDEIAMPIMRVFSPETAHNISVKFAKYKLIPSQKMVDAECLSTTVWGRSFPNPVGLAAGFDKQGEAVDGLLKIGFGFVEVGSVTPEPQAGNEKPRVFRLSEDKAVINRYGFNSDGHEIVYSRLNSRLSVKEPKKGIVGVNLGKNKTSSDPIGDYIKGVEKFGSLADYLVINISSPNTPGLRDLQRQEELKKLLEKVVQAKEKLSVKPKPLLLLKIAPDLTPSEKKDIAQVVLKLKGGIDGLIVSNTTVSRPELLKSKNKEEVGGLSGAPLRDLSLQAIKDMYVQSNGEIPIIGVGGISNGQDAYDKIKAGASLIQIYTALVYQGHPVVGKIKRELEDLLKKDGYSSLSQAVGVEAKMPQKPT